jgi:hypothetical protein
MDSSESMSFQKVVLIVAIIALILVLSFIGYMMYYTEQSKPYPPTDGASRCPDATILEVLYWKTDIVALLA